jgi:hypothetical protein
MLSMTYGESGRAVGRPATATSTTFYRRQHSAACQFRAASDVNAADPAEGRSKRDRISFLRVDTPSGRLLIQTLFGAVSPATCKPTTYLGHRAG